MSLNGKIWVGKVYEATFFVISIVITKRRKVKLLCLLEYVIGLKNNVNIRVTYSRLPVPFCNQYNYNDISILNLYRGSYKAVVNEPVLRSRSVACWTHPGVRWGRWTWSCNRETRVSKGVTTQLSGTQYHSNYLRYSNMIVVYMFIQASIYLDSATLWI